MHSTTNFLSHLKGHQHTIQIILEDALQNKKNEHEKKEAM